MKELVVRSAGDTVEAGLVEDGRLTDYLPADDGGEHEIHLGRIVRIERKLGAAMVELTRGEAWLDLAKAKVCPPGHDLHEGTAVVVQITRPACADKGPRASSDIVLGDGAAMWRPGKEPAPGAHLRTLYETIRARAAGARPPALLHAPDRVRGLLDQARRFGAGRVVADDHLAMLKVRRALGDDRDVPVGHEPGAWQMVADQLAAALAREVALPSGVSLVIEPTRALTVIDVNGRGLSPLEIDLEAVVPIAREIRLRRIGGIVVVDFVDLRRKGERERLHAALRAAFASDPLPVEVLPMTRLGLVQLTRKRTGPSLDEMLLRACPACAGSGRLVREEVRP